jgi:hypothetical protein
MPGGRSDDDVHPEREEGNGKTDRGPDPDTQDDRKTSDNGKGK